MKLPFAAPAAMAAVRDLVQDHDRQRTGLVEDRPVDVVDGVQKTLENEGDLTALAQSTGCDKAPIRCDGYRVP